MADSKVIWSVHVDVNGDFLFDDRTSCTCAASLFQTATSSVYRTDTLFVNKVCGSRGKDHALDWGEAKSVKYLGLYPPCPLSHLITSLPNNDKAPRRPQDSGYSTHSTHCSLHPSLLLPLSLFHSLPFWLYL